MSFNVAQFKTLIERVLSELDPDLASPVAVKLLLGTAAQESRFGTFLHQLGGGPAKGAFQMEPATFEWLQDRYQEKYPAIFGRKASDMEWDLRLSIIMCRLRYRIVKDDLPADDLMSLASYWKLWYNTPKGAGTPEQFVENYRKYVHEV